MTDGEKQQRDLDDKILMRRLKDGDDSALNELMAHWKETLVSFLYRYTGNWGVAVDLAQDTFVRVYQSSLRYEPQGLFSTWIFTIASNLARNEARWRKRHPGSLFSHQPEEEKVDPLERVETSEPAPDQVAERGERWQRVQEAVSRLPGALRTVVLLFEYEGLSYTEIAAIENCSPKAVETRLYRARAQLRDALRDLE